MRKNVLHLNQTLPKRVTRRLDFSERASSIVKLMDMELACSERSPHNPDVQILGLVEARDEREGMVERTVQVVQGSNLRFLARSQELL